MRLLLKIFPQKYIPFAKINKHAIQGMLYSQLKGTKYENLHTKKGFKFFTFSDIFPSNDYYPRKEKSLLISSPDKGLINAWYHSFKKSRYIYLSNEPFLISNVKKFSIPLRPAFETGSPVTLYKENTKNEYFSFEKGGDLWFFINRLKENAIKKYNIFYDDEFHLDELIFDKFILKKEVVVQMKKGANKFSVIGTMWKLLQKEYLSKENRKFYRFIMDCGLGEKNSLGFGFVNPKKEGK